MFPCKCPWQILKSSLKVFNFSGACEVFWDHLLHSSFWEWENKCFFSQWHEKLQRDVKYFSKYLFKGMFQAMTADETSF